MAVVRPGSGADAMRACVRARAGSKPAREPSRAMGQAGSARDGEPRFRARDPHVRRRPIVARHEGVRTQRPVRAALTGFFSVCAWCSIPRETGWFRLQHQVKCSLEVAAPS